MSERLRGWGDESPMLVQSAVEDSRLAHVVFSVDSQTGLAQYNYRTRFKIQYLNSRDFFLGKPVSMGKVFESLDSKIQDWIAKQHLFFVATAPTNGHINLSPKGNDTLRVLDENTLAFMDTGGSGIETVAHLRENGRIVIMMCAFEGPPKIFRFHGQGTIVAPNDEEFPSIASHFNNTQLGIRTIIKVNVTRISDSCGFGVPLFDYNEERRGASEFLGLGSNHHPLPPVLVL